MTSPTIMPGEPVFPEVAVGEPLPCQNPLIERQVSRYLPCWGYWGPRRVEGHLWCRCHGRKQSCPPRGRARRHDRVDAARETSCRRVCDGSGEPGGVWDGSEVFVPRRWQRRSGPADAR